MSGQPVAWMYERDGKRQVSPSRVTSPRDAFYGWTETPLYTSPQGWRPISTAPRDGTVIFITSTSPLWKYPFPARWNKDSDWWDFADYPLNDVWGVSDLVDHWMPLPDAPPPPTDNGGQ